MCTAATLKTRDHYFGRTLDFDFSYSETVTVTPRSFPFKFRMAGEIPSHYALIGMAFVAGGYPLYYDCTNEKGLSMAGLNFPGYAEYKDPVDGKDNIAPFEFIPWILCRCETVGEARVLLERINIANIDFSPELPASTLHWIISDRDSSIVVESVKEGLKIYDNPFGILTNSPPFDFQLLNVATYLNCTREEAVNRFADGVEIVPFSRGMGGFGIPGDLSSSSRFVKAAFTKLNTVCGDSENESISQFFHILGSVAQQKGCCRVGKEFEYTIYSSCCNTDRGIYYYTTYENSRISAVDMHRTDLDASVLTSYPLIEGQQIEYQN